MSLSNQAGVTRLTQLKKGCVALSVGLAVSLLPATVMATNGYFANGYGVKAKGTVGAGVANPQDAIAAATNPSGMVLIGNRFDFGIEYFKPDRSAKTRDDNVSYDGNGDSTFLIPEIGYNHMLNDNMSMGVTIYGNGGMNTKYKSIPQYSGSATGPNTGMNMEQLFIAPTFAYKLNNKHAIGVSLNLIYQTFEATGLQGFCGFKSGGCTGNQTTDRAGLTDQGTDTSTGYSIKIGYTGKLLDNLTVGFAYQTKADMSKFSKYNQLFAEQGDFDIPSNWTLGLAFKPIHSMNILFDVQRINYSEVASIANPNGTGAGTGALGANNGRGFGWDDMTIFKLGVEYKLGNSTILRAGYSKGNQPIGADDTAFNLIAPAVIEEQATLGASIPMGKTSEISIFYMHAFENTVKGNTVGAGSNGNADLTMSQDALGMAYGWAF